ncbi:MAG: DUF484 family protein [Rhodospirillaceae bacterium]|jgi:uncharacterized protein|nr:DUF484 family protein [Rhodospirillaceae bacterium]MBT4218652.1 DUF484 family protein [Rhodospirillaceae bacterium]MBT4463311.1 DUF484 family protein [Rhodospirillaceae bacterium]MBT5014523.1 DUF484 family protein [Rhodospirillaceae bacterium]MBT5309132.1 DUF484 family protein [Rhodospirillaceae bacterium]
MGGHKNDASVEDTDALTDDKITEYLANNPDFLARNPEIVKSLTAPSRWDGDGVADMQKFMLEQLRGEIDNLRDCAQDVIETSRTNMSIQTRVHTAVLALLSADGFADTVKVVTDDLPLLLDIDVAVVGFEPPDDRSDPKAAKFMLSDINRLSLGDVERFVGIDQDVLLLREVFDDDSIFGEGAGLVHSAALARLRPGNQTPPGMVALGSRGNVFYPGQGTELISFLARVLERCFDRWQTTD